MLQYFDKTFFRFLFGFAGILAASFLVLIAVGYYEVEVNDHTANSGVVEVETAQDITP